MKTDLRTATVMATVAAALTLGTWAATVRADTLIDHPFLLVSPTAMDLGRLRPGEGATNSFLVENVGGGILVGTATVPPPFRIVSGGSYRVPRSGAQVVTIVYTPNGSPTNTQVVTFTGGAGDIRATVTVSHSTKRWPYYLQPK